MSHECEETEAENSNSATARSDKAKDVNILSK